MKKNASWKNVNVTNLNFLKCQALKECKKLMYSLSEYYCYWDGFWS